MSYYAIYDGNCNLCVTFVQQLEQLDRGKIFQYIPMQDTLTLSELGVTAQDCEQGMMLINAAEPSQRWQGSAAAEEIGKLLPGVDLAVDLYRWVPGLKWLGDRGYLQIRDNRYAWFGKRDRTYLSPYQFKSCQDDRCSV
ncbi:thiol-disulfide oxidoreductase DCC family protein [Chamaesiphon polymorphus]|uniref:Thiol-disulfide oxidoreductase n=1 Tax=Chamaesiphon polymorphus CCALA 037 TaxID=2107692 RepID=A0A2T1GJP0_9CYAN|nr:DCC1-like thiol-disulfide oxidoreductase family protein [Chamaesiphon polymorphus]PSB58017.1 thiol-disulfide oxidoreductase [Chamaesiphon polymorphus CCALA 037]